MAKHVTIQPTKTYATAENAIKAVDRVITNPDLADLRYLIMRDAVGRFFPLFVGEKAVHAGIHWHFAVVA